MLENWGNHGSSSSARKLGGNLRKAEVGLKKEEMNPSRNKSAGENHPVGNKRREGSRS